MTDHWKIRWNTVETTSSGEGEGGISVETINDHQEFGQYISDAVEIVRKAMGEPSIIKIEIYPPEDY